MSRVGTLTGALPAIDEPASAAGLMEQGPASVDAPAGGDDRRSADPLDRLSRRLDHVCTMAVDPLEIAAVLDADGLNDSLARERFGLDDVFAIAEELHARVPIRAHGRRAPGTVGVSRWRAGRGALFALPGAYFLALQDAISSRLATIVLVAVTIAGWAASQAVSVLAHAVLARGGRSAALGLLRRVLIGSAGTTAAVGAAGTIVLGWPVTLTAVALALALYIVAATSLVFVEADILLAASLVPGAIAAATSAIVPSVARDRATVMVAMSVSVGLVVIAAVARTRGAVRVGARPRRAEYLRAAPFTAYGALAGMLVAAPLLNVLFTGGRASGPLVLGMLPLTLSMGFAELELRRHARVARAALVREQQVAGFARAAFRSLAHATVRYVAALVALNGVVLGVFALTGRDPLGQLPLMGAYLMLGPALFLGLVMSAAGGVVRVAWSLVGALAGVAMLVRVAGMPIDAAFAVGCGGLLAALAIDGFHEVKRVVNHR